MTRYGINKNKSVLRQITHFKEPSVRSETSDIYIQPGTALPTKNKPNNPNIVIYYY